jgi:hypothetical protein
LSSHMVAGSSNHNVSKNTGVSGKVPSLASLVDNSFGTKMPQNNNTNNKASNNSTANLGGGNKTKPKELMITSSDGNNVASSSNITSQSNRTNALAQMLEEDPLRRRFRRFLATIKAEESIRFYDSIEAFQKEPESKRANSARAIIRFFIQDSAPKQINLKADTRNKLLDAVKRDDRTALAQITFFDEAMAEVFDDLKQSDAFQQFLNAGGTTSINLGEDVSDVSLS